MPRARRPRVADCAFACSASQASNSAWDSTTTGARMVAWPVPQSSVQTRLNVPSLSGVTTNWLSIPSSSGSAGRDRVALDPPLGHPEGVEDVERRHVTSSWRSTGTWSSLVVTGVALPPVPTICSGYSKRPLELLGGHVSNTWFCCGSTSTYC